MSGVDRVALFEVIDAELRMRGINRRVYAELVAPHLGMADAGAVKLIWRVRHSQTVDLGIADGLLTAIDLNLNDLPEAALPPLTGVGER